MKRILCVILVFSMLIILVNARAETTPVSVRHGDVSGDGKVSAADALMVLQYGVGKREFSGWQLKAAEVADNSGTNAVDALHILQYGVGKRKTFSFTPALKNQSFTLATYRPQTYESQAWQSVLAETEQKYGLNLSITDFSVGKSIYEDLAKEILAGKVSGDILEVGFAAARNLYRQNCLANLKNAPMNTTLRNHVITEAMTVGNHTFGVGVDDATSLYGVFYDKALLEQYAPQYDLDQLVADKQWNLETFRQVASACTVDTNGDNKSDIYGFTSNTSIITAAAFSQHGGWAVMEEGKVVSTMKEPSAPQSIQWCKTLFKTDRTWRYFADINDGADLFVKRKVAMFIGHVDDFAKIFDELYFGWGYLPMPLGEDQTEYAHAVGNGAVYVIPNNGKKRLAAVAFLNELALGGDALMQGHQELWYKTGADEWDVERMKTVMDSATPEYSQGAISQTVLSQLEASVTSASKCPGTIYPAIYEAIPQELDQFYARFYS